MTANTEAGSPSAEDHLRQGKVHIAATNYQEAISNYLAANALQPENPQTSLGLGMALSLAGRHLEARITLEHALTQSPQNPDYAFALAEAHNRAGNTNIAEKIYRQILLAHPRHLMTAQNLGVLLYREERFAEAAGQHLNTLNTHPDSRATWRDLGQSLIAAGQLEDGIAVLETAHQTFPDDHTTRFALGLALLRNECWTQGWALYEARWHLDEQLPSAPGAKPWSGEALDGKHLVIFSEQGFGDSIMFVRYLPLLAAEASQVTLIVQAPLVTLFIGSFEALGNVTVIATGKTPPVADFSIPMASLALHCQSRGLTAPPMQIPYLRVHARPLSPLLASDNRKNIGLVWRGNHDYTANHRRSLTLDFLWPHLPKGNHRYFSLQIAPTSEEKRSLATAGIIDLSAKLSSFSDTAAWLEALDGLICVDTAIAHLAGALGRPTLMLRRNEGEWRWGSDQSCRNWYVSLKAITRSTISSLNDGVTIALPWDI